MKTGTKIILGLLAAAGLGVVVYFATRKSKNPYKPSTEYDVDPQYKLPNGAAELGLESVPQEMIDAVRWVHRYFQPHEAYADTTGNIYLVELHEGFDPLVFKVAPKETTA